jgi:exoV-like protein
MLHDCNSQTIVWGSGFLSNDDKFKLKEKPKKVLAVRGKLSRQFLLEQGVECPEVYGDPALLLPLFYKAHKKKRYKLGVVAHIYDESNPLVQGLKGNNDVIIISLQSYDNWLHVIDKISECELILSSSLHGIIVSDAYGIPNAWVEFSDKVIGNGFKFRDYFSSVSKNISEPIRITTPIDINNLDRYKKTWEAPTCDLNKLIEASPFLPLKEKLEDGLLLSINNSSF